MESSNALLRWRKQSLKPIETKRNGREARSEAILDEEPLSPSAHMFNQPNFNVHVLAILGSMSKIYPQVVKEKLVHTLIKHPRFSSIQVVDEKTGEMKWVRTEVDLDQHVVVPDISSNIEEPDKFVENYVYNLSKSNLDRSKPLWELHLLNVKTSHAEGVGVFRIHHSLGDGTSLMSLLLACTRQVAQPHQLPTIPVKKRKNPSSQTLSRGFWKYLAALWFFFKKIRNTIVDVVMFGATALFLKDTKTPIKSPPGSEFNQKDSSCFDHILDLQKRQSASAPLTEAEG